MTTAQTAGIPANGLPAMLESVDLPGGGLRILWVPAFVQPTRPVALVLHGALGSVGALVQALPVLAAEFEPVLVDLPGHGGSPPPARMDVNAFAERIVALIAARYAGRRILLVGESFGGLVALAVAALGAPVEAVVAVDPPLSTAKQWHIGAAFRAQRAAHPEDRFVPAFGEAIFGIGSDPGVIAERLYYPLLAASGRPVLLVTGDTPLGQPRQVSRVACCLDAVDEYVIARSFSGNVRLARIPDSGHVVLREKPAAVHAAIMRFWPAAGAEGEAA